MVDTMFGPMPIIYEDKEFIILNKPHGLHTIDDRQQLQSQTVRSLLDKRYGKIYIVHRLDAGTGGVLVCAKTPAMHSKLCGEFEKGLVAKEYLALVSGVFETSVTLMLPIQTKASKGKYKVNFKSGKSAVTSFMPLSVHGEKSLLRVIPYTGRTHQIRVHLKVLRYPLYQDWLYNKPCEDRRLTLFAKSLRILGQDFGAGLSEFIETKL